MKKQLSFFLMIIIALLLSACGANSTEQSTETPKTTTAEIVITTTEETNPPIIEIGLDETITVGVYEFTIKETKFVKNFNPNGDLGGYYCADGNVHFVVKTSFKNIGKTETRVPENFLILEYGDGYTFRERCTFHFNPNTGHYLVDAYELPVLSNAKNCQTFFEVPKEVETSSEPLIIHITIAGEEYLFRVR